MAWYLKYYKHRECRTRWTDEWSCACNDHCPRCHAEIEPYDWDDLTVVVDENGDGTWTVLASPMSAEHSPDYAASEFETKWTALRFAAIERARLRRELERQFLR